MVFVSSETRKENTAVHVPWLLDNIPATGALLRMEWILHIMFSGIFGGGGKPGDARFPRHRASEHLCAHSLHISASPCAPVRQS